MDNNTILIIINAIIFFGCGWIWSRIYYTVQTTRLKAKSIADARKAIGGMKSWVITSPGALSAINLQIPEDIPDTTAQVPAEGGQGANIKGTTFKDS